MRVHTRVHTKAIAQVRERSAGGGRNGLQSLECWLSFSSFTSKRLFIAIAYMSSLSHLAGDSRKFGPTEKILLPKTFQDFFKLPGNTRDFDRAKKNAIFI